MRCTLHPPCDAHHEVPVPLHPLPSSRPQVATEGLEAAGASPRWPHLQAFLPGQGCSAVAHTLYVPPVVRRVMACDARLCVRLGGRDAGGVLSDWRGSGSRSGP